MEPSADPGLAVLLSEQADAILSRLPSAVSDAIRTRLEYLRDMPRLYPLSHDGLFPGARTFWVAPCYRVYYLVGADGAGVYVVSIAAQEVDLGDGEPERL